MKLPLSFYLQEDVGKIAKSLLGKTLISKIDRAETGGIIVETESYAGITDRASHAYGGRRTDRTETMYKKGGIAYVYLCYGMHHLLNVVTNIEGIPHAVLIRALEPTIGIDTMLKRRKKEKLNPSLCGGPGALSQALGITKNHDGVSFTGALLFIEERNVLIDKEQILASPRVGVEYAKEDALLDWRFRIKENIWTSPAK